MRSLWSCLRTSQASAFGRSPQSAQQLCSAAWCRRSQSSLRMIRVRTLLTGPNPLYTWLLSPLPVGQKTVTAHLTLSGAQAHIVEHAWQPGFVLAIWIEMIDAKGSQNKVSRNESGPKKTHKSTYCKHSRLKMDIRSSPQIIGFVCILYTHVPCINCLVYILLHVMYLLYLATSSCALIHWQNLLG